MRRHLAWIVVALAAAMSAAAEASFLGVCGVTPTPVDLIAVQINPAGQHLALPGVVASGNAADGIDACLPPIGSGGPVAGWTEVYNDGVTAIAMGPFAAVAVNALFLGALGDLYAASVVMFDGDELVFNAAGAYGLDFPSWLGSPPTRAELDALVGAVPEPATLVLLALGLAGIGLTRGHDGLRAVRRA